MRKIRTYGGYFESFMATLTPEQQRKIQYGLLTFFVFDEGNVVVLFNGFQKKSRKTPRKELLIAQQLMKEYYGRAR